MAEGPWLKAHGLKPTVKTPLTLPEGLGYNLTILF
jgi:hypothetical protein